MERTSAIRNLSPWQPSADELAGILAEMRPIIADFTRRAAAFLAASGAEAPTRRVLTSH